MVELFQELPVEIKKYLAEYVDITLAHYDIQDAATMVAEFANACFHESEQEFLDFYFKLRLEQLTNESNND